VLTDDDERPGDSLLELVQRAVPPTYFLVGNELQRERVGQPRGQLAKDLGLRQRRHLHVLRAPRI
jgi:hypothetical protein